MKENIAKIKSILKENFFKYKVFIVLIGLLFLYSVFIESNKTNVLFFIFFYSFIFILVNANNCYQINNKMLFYLTSLGKTRRSILKKQIVHSIKSLILLVLGLLLYNLFIFVYAKKTIFSVVSIDMILTFILLYALYSLLGFLFARFKVKLEFFFLIIILLIGTYFLMIYYANINWWLVNGLLFGINLALTYIFKKIFHKDILLIEF